MFGFDKLGIRSTQRQLFNVNIMSTMRGRERREGTASLAAAGDDSGARAENDGAGQATRVVLVGSCEAMIYCVDDDGWDESLQTSC